MGKRRRECVVQTHAQTLPMFVAEKARRVADFAVHSNSALHRSDIICVDAALENRHAFRRSACAQAWPRASVR